MKQSDLELLLDGVNGIFESRSGLANIKCCMETIAATKVGSVPLRRDFGTNWDWVDMPLQASMARYRAALIEAIEKHEPRVEVTKISFKADTSAASDVTSAASNGRLIPIVKFKIKEGVQI